MSLKSRLAFAAALAVAVAVPLSASAHRAWILPSFTVLSGDDPWVGVDAAISNELFYPDHFPMQAKNLKVITPDGEEGQLENAVVGKYRSTFDLHLTKPGTYKIVQENGQSRNETFITRGAPTTTVLKTTGKGLELQAVTHPNDLVAGEPAKFIFLLNGQPAADLEVTVLPGASRYRDQPGEIKVKTAADGSFTIKWPEPGYFWLNASIRPPRTETTTAAAKDHDDDDHDDHDAPRPAAPPPQAGQQSGPGAPGAPGGGRRGRGVSYTATFEVMQP